MRKTYGLSAQFKAGLAPHAEQIRFVALYGSVAKGSNHARSDVDLLIVGDISLEQAPAAVFPVESRIGREIGVRFYGAEEFRKRRAQGDPFPNNVLGGSIAQLIETPDDA